MAKQQLTVLYDPTCGLCLRCRQWLAKQPALIPLRFVPQQSARQQALYPNLELKTDAQGRPDEFIVVDEAGRVYRGDKGWLMCFYALRDYRGLAMRLARPGMAGLARRAYHLISANRRVLGWLGARPDDAWMQTLQASADPPRCHNAVDAFKQAKAKTAQRYTPAPNEPERPQPDAET